MNQFKITFQDKEGNWSHVIYYGTDRNDAAESFRNENPDCAICKIEEL
jgi:hypothetical protein